MSYSAKVGDMNGFDLDIIAMGSRRRAKAESEKKALVNSEKYTEPGPRVLSGGMDTNDKLKAVAAVKIEEMYSTAPIRTRAIPSAPPTEPKTRAVPKKAEPMMQTRRIPSERAVTAQREAPRRERATPPPTPQRQRRTKVYTAKKKVTAIQTRRDKNRNPIPIGAVSAILIITVLMLYFIVLYIQSYELNENISDMKDELSSKLMTQTTWQTRVEEKNPSLDKIEEFATQDGMVRKTPDKYISITPDEDIIERYDNQ